MTALLVTAIIYFMGVDFSATENHEELQIWPKHWEINSEEQKYYKISVSVLSRP